MRNNVRVNLGSVKVKTKMQKLGSENINTPTNTSLVRSNCDLQLNRDESLSVANKKTFHNNPEVNLSQYVEKQNLRVSAGVHTCEGMEKPYPSLFLSINVGGI